MNYDSLILCHPALDAGSRPFSSPKRIWIPASAGMTDGGVSKISQMLYWSHRLSVRTPRFSAGGGSASGGQCGKPSLQTNNMVYFLYILKSIRHHRYYIGIAENVEKRLVHHNNGQVRSTKGYRPWNLIHCRTFTDKTSARKFEIYLKKNYQARKALFQEIENL